MGTRSAARHHGAILLEVLISLGLLVFGLAVVGLRVTTSLESARKSEIWTTGVLLAEMKLAEFQAGAVKFKLNDSRVAGHFGITYPGYSWQIKFEPCEIENLYLMELDIGYNPAAIPRQIASPESDIDIEDDGTKLVRSVYRLVPTPADLDLKRDLGIDMEELQAAAAAGGAEKGGEGGEAAGGPGGDLWAMVSEFLTKHPEILNGSGGIDLEAIKNLPPEDFKMVKDILQQFVGRGMNFSQLEEQLGDKLGKNDGKDQASEGGGPSERSDDKSNADNNAMDGGGPANPNATGRPPRDRDSNQGPRNDGGNRPGNDNANPDSGPPNSRDFNRRPRPGNDNADRPRSPDANRRPEEDDNGNRRPGNSNRSGNDRSGNNRPGNNSNSSNNRQPNRPRSSNNDARR